MQGTNLTAPPVLVSEACVDTILDNFGADVDALLTADGLDDPYGLVYGTTNDGHLTRLLWAAHALLTADLGRSEVLGASAIDPSVREALSRVGRRTGQAQVNALLYDYITSEIDVTTVATGPDVAAAMQRGTLLLIDLPRGIDGASVLVHEARHRHGPEHILCDGLPICDVDRSGAIGFQMAVHELAWRSTEDELVRKLSDAWIDALTQQIVDISP